MQEYIKLFDTPQDGDNYKIKDIPFFCYVNETGQDLVCNQEHKYLYNINNELVIDFPPTPNINFIDLGLSVKWAQYNEGVDLSTQLENVEDWYGNYYAWGEIVPKSDYSWLTYKHANFDYNKLIKYCPIDKTDYWDGDGDPDNKLVLNNEDDLFKRKYYEDWESKYRIPTKEELEELLNLPNKWITDFKGISGLNGRIFAKTQVELDGTFNDDTMLFIPAAGYFYGSAHYDAGSSCGLWSSSLDSDGPNYAWGLRFSSGSIYLSDYSRCSGFSVRCVSTD